MAQSSYGLMSRRDAIFVMLAAALPVLGYQFGLGNQVEQFSIVRRLSDPDFIPADFYVNSAVGVWSKVLLFLARQPAIQFCALAIRHFHIDLRHQFRACVHQF